MIIKDETIGDLWELEKIVEALEGLPIKEKLAALEDGEWLANFSVTQEAIESLYADLSVYAELKKRE